MSAPGFKDLLALRLQDLHDFLVAQHEFAVQQAMGHSTQQRTLGHSQLCSEIKVLDLQMACESTDPLAKTPPLTQRSLASPDAFAGILDCLYMEDEPLELVSALLQDATLCFLYAANRGCRECFREMLTQRRAQLQRQCGPLLGGAVAGVTRTTRNRSLVSRTASEVEWLSMAEPPGIGCFSSDGWSLRGSSAHACGTSLRGNQDLPQPTLALRCRSVLTKDFGHCELDRGERGKTSRKNTGLGSRQLDRDEGEGRAPAELQDLGHCKQGKEECEARAPAEMQDVSHRKPGRAEDEARAPVEMREVSLAEPAQNATQEEAAGLQTQQDQHSQDAMQEEVASLPAQEHPDPAAPEESGEDKLTMVLVKAKPSWTSRDRTSAQSKLDKVGVRTVEDLVGALRNKLNDRLQQAGMKPFTSSTLQALTKCVIEYALNGTEVPTIENAKVDAAQATHANSKDTEQGAEGEETLLGLWVGDEGSFSYEIRSLDDGGFRQDLGPVGAPPVDRTGGEHGTGLWYAERLASGEMLAGVLEHGADPRWPWEAGLQDGSRLRFRHDFARVLVSEHYVPGSSTWGQRRIAERPQAYAFFNAMEHKEGFRYVHLPSEGGGVGGFPLIGLTAGWVPAALSGDKENAVANHSQVSVKLLGSFCDPFDIAQHRTLHSMVKEIAQQLPTAASSMRRGMGRGGGFPFQ